VKELEEERSYSVMERLLFYTLPVLFTLLLTGVLLTVFGYDVVNETLRVGNKIPGVASVLPDPKPSEEELREAIRQAKQNKASGEVEPTEEAAATKATLSEKEAEIAALQTSVDAKEAEIEVLRAELEAAKTTSAQEAATEEQYTANIGQLAQVYAQMKASKAAPVLEALTLSERVLVLKEMKEDEQVDILEKMEPTVAAETSILLKDVVAAKDLQIAALQERLALSGSDPPTTTQLTRDEVSRTFAQMTPERAAEVLLLMAEANEASVVNILRTMEEASRATILDSLAKLDKQRTAKLTSKLG
jgi:flagellar motility protein MotE (MotC chaperone)